MCSEVLGGSSSSVATPAGDVTSPLPVVEDLEKRAMLSITISPEGVVNVVGTADGDDVVIRVDPNNANNLQVYDEQVIRTYTRAQVAGIVVQGLGGNDRLFIDNNSGFVAKGGGGLPIRFDGGAGDDRVLLTGDANGAQLNGGYGVGGKAGTGAMLTIDRANGLSQQVSFTGLEDLFDVTPAVGLTISGNARSNVMEVVNGPAVNSQSTGMVRTYDVTPCNTPDGDGHGGHVVKQQTHVPIVFANKVSVFVKGQGKNDWIDVNVAQLPVGLRSLRVDGGRGTDEVADRTTPDGLKTSFRNLERINQQRQFAFVTNHPTTSPTATLGRDDDGGDRKKKSTATGSHKGSGSRNASGSRDRNGSKSGSRKGSHS